MCPLAIDNTTMLMQHSPSNKVVGLSLSLSLFRLLRLTLIPLSYGAVCVIVVALMEPPIHFHIAFSAVLVVIFCSILRGLGKILSLCTSSIPDPSELICIQLLCRFWGRK